MRESVRSIIQRKHFSTHLQNSTFNNCQKLLSQIFPCTRTLRAPLGPQFSFCGHTALVVAFGRQPGALEGPRCDICHMLHIVPLQNRNHSILKYWNIPLFLKSRHLQTSISIPATATCNTNIEIAIIDIYDFVSKEIFFGSSFLTLNIFLSKVIITGQSVEVIFETFSLMSPQNKHSSS